MHFFTRLGGLITLACVLSATPLQAQEPAPPVTDPGSPAVAPVSEPSAPPDAVAPPGEAVPPAVEPAAQPPAEPVVPEAVQPGVGAVGPSDPVAEARDLDARLVALDAYLKDQQPRSRAYFGTWISMMSVLAVGQGVQAVFEDDPATRAGLIMGASFSTTGLILVLIAPTPGRYGYRKFSAMPQDSIEQKKAKAIQGEEFLRGEAAAVRRTHGWFTHVIGATLGVGGFLGLYLGYDDNLENALRTGIGTIAVTELRIWTRPKRAIRYLDAYRNSPTSVPPPATFALVPMMLPRAQGLVLAGMF